MTSTTSTPPPAEIVTALTDAARQALHAPSVFNSQPWRWRIAADTLELFADRGRQLTVIDPEGRLLLISCGAALHHARVALGAAGLQVEVARFPEPGDPDLLARITVFGRQDPAPEDIRLCDAIPLRRTDRRAFGDTPVPAAVLMRWTKRPAESGDGVPPSAAVRQGPRQVPVRDYALDAEPGLDVGEDNDRGATYAILFGAHDAPGLGVGADPAGLPPVPRRDPAEVIEVAARR